MVLFIQIGGGTQLVPTVNLLLAVLVVFLEVTGT